MKCYPGGAYERNLGQERDALSAVEVRYAATIRHDMPLLKVLDSDGWSHSAFSWA